MAVKVTPEKLGKAIQDELQRYSDDKAEQIAGIIDDVATNAKNTLRRTSPRKTGRYQKGWRISSVTDKKGRYVKAVHNKTDYQLTHLLEKGHANKRTGKFTPAIVHIAPVEETAVNEVVERIEEVLKR